MSENFSMKSNLKEVLYEVERAIQNGLTAIGMTAEGYAKDECPVDTGRLRNSITFATTTDHGKGGDGDDSTVRSNPEPGSVYIGTNVEYAPFMENGSYHHDVGNKHFLKHAAANHTDEYQKILIAALKSSNN